MIYYACHMAPIRKVALYKSFGALEIAKFVADGTPRVWIATIPETLHCAPDEPVIFGWSVWPSKEVLAWMPVMPGFKEMVDALSLQQTSILNA